MQSQFENRFRFGLRQRRGYRNGHPAKFSVSKTILISTVDAALHVGELKFAGGLSERDAMKGELQDFRRKVSDAGRSQYGARDGAHDDLVLAVSIGLWLAKRFDNRPQVICGIYGTAFP